jgi:hypothetical protein
MLVNKKLAISKKKSFVQTKQIFRGHEESLQIGDFGEGRATSDK